MTLLCIKTEYYVLSMLVMDRAILRINLIGMLDMCILVVHRRVQSVDSDCTENTGMYGEYGVHMDHVNSKYSDETPGK